MSPQNGHTRWDAKSPSCASIPNIFLTEAAMKARRLRARTMSGCKTVSIINSTILHNVTSDDDTEVPVILCKSARSENSHLRRGLRSHVPEQHTSHVSKCALSDNAWGAQLNDTQTDSMRGTTSN